MNLGGEIPYSIANLTELVTLELPGNQLNGHIPHWIGNLSQIELLNLANNQLNGSIPEGIFRLSNLDTLYLGNNSNLSANFGGFLKLEYLIDLDLSGFSLTFPHRSIANESVAQFISLDLSSCNLTKLPQFLQNQTMLQDLTFSDNKIFGLIPQWFVTVTRESLSSLDLSNNRLTGFENPVETLPWSVIELLNLRGNKLRGSIPIPVDSTVIYQVSNNLLSGGISEQICRVRSLSYLDVSNNMLAGQIPNCVSELSVSLAVLNLRGNNFRGIIPRDYPESCKLKMINLSQNQLEGTLPRSLANCTMLEVLDIGQNQVRDTFPSWLGSISDLKMLVLRHNKFHGKIGTAKPSLGFQSLRIIDLSNNFHTAELPSDFLQSWDAMKVAEEQQSNASSTIIHLGIYMPSEYLCRDEEYRYSITITNKGNDMLYSKILNVFRVVDFSSNSFTGSIPDCIGELEGLQALNLSNNNLHGNIPPLSNMLDIESLDLSKNILSGEIPQKLSELRYLEVFNVSHNSLVGSIPQGNQFDAFDNSSFAGNTGLCGSPLSQKCGDGIEPPTTPPSGTMDEDEDNLVLIDWIIRSFGCVAGFVVGYVIGNYITDKNHDWFTETFGRRQRTRKRGGRITRRRN